MYHNPYGWVGSGHKGHYGPQSDNQAQTSGQRGISRVTPIEGCDHDHSASPPTFSLRAWLCDSDGAPALQVCVPQDQLHGLELVAVASTLARLLADMAADARAEIAQGN